MFEKNIWEMKLFFILKHLNLFLLAFKDVESDEIFSQY